MNFKSTGTPSRVHRFRRARPSLSTSSPFSSASSFDSVLSFYDVLPEWATVDLLSFETLAIERIRVLKVVEIAKQGQTQRGDELRHKVEKELRESHDLQSYALNNLRSPSSSLVEEAHLDGVRRNRERDLVSHFILRLAFSRSEELRRWFIQQEVELFRLRCQGLSSDELQTVMHCNHLDFDECSQDEKSELSTHLKNSFSHLPQGLEICKTSKFFKVPFTEVLELVKMRKVFIKRGICYVPESEMVLLLTSLFRSLLTHAMVHTSRVLPVSSMDDRISNLLLSIDENDTASLVDDQWQQKSNQVAPDQIGQLAVHHFPMCMKSMQRALEGQHHLKYKARLQYGLFLKGIGLSMEDAIKFFRHEFGRSGIDNDKFDKQYLYNIRYNYGQEGKKVNWSPWNCLKIIRETVSAGDCHGCPYRHSDLPKLKAMLAADIGDEGKIQEILDTVNEKHYQKACGLHFSATHTGLELSTGLITSHPNQFYAESRDGNLKVDSGSKKSHNVKTERGVVFGNNKEAKENYDDEMIDESILEQMDTDNFYDDDDTNPES